MVAAGVDVFIERAREPDGERGVDVVAESPVGHAGDRDREKRPADAFHLRDGIQDAHQKSCSRPW